MIPSALMPVATHLWESTVFAAFAALLAVLCRSNRAHVRYWIWFWASAKFLIPFSLLADAGALTGRYVQSPLAPAILLFEQAATPLAAPVSKMAATADQPYVNTALTALAAIWLAGFVALAGRRIFGWLRLRALVREAEVTPLPGVGLPAKTSRAFEQVGVFGVMRPTLLLPEGITGLLSPAELQAIFMHEAAHVRRRDNLTAAIHVLVESAFWFHPLVWWLSARLIEERERACDEAVLLAGVEPHTYAEGLLKVCDYYLSSPSWPAAGFKDGDLKRRIEAIASHRIAGTLSRTKKAALAFAGVSAVAVPVLIGLDPSFNAVSIKGGPSRPMNSIDLNLFKGFQFSQNGVLDLRETTVDLLIQLAYNIDSSQLAQGPSWIYSDRFKVLAQTDVTVNPEQMRPMIRALLADRFNLALHREVRRLPGYELTVASGGPKLRPAGEGSCVPLGRADAQEPPDPSRPRPLDTCGGVRMQMLPAPPTPRGRVEAVAVTIPKLVELVTIFVPRRIVDNTGIKGTYSFQLEFLHTPAQPEPPIIAALEQQLGLRLSPADLPAEVLIIDRVERPIKK